MNVVVMQVRRDTFLTARGLSST